MFAGNQARAFTALSLNKALEVALCIRLNMPAELTLLVFFTISIGDRNTKINVITSASCAVAGRSTRSSSTSNGIKTTWEKQRVVIPAEALMFYLRKNRECKLV